MSARTVIEWAVVVFAIVFLIPICVDIWRDVFKRRGRL